MGESFKECELIIKISLIKTTNNLTLTALAKAIGTSSSSPTFVNVIKTLNEKKIIEIHNYIGHTKLVTIKENKITDYIDNMLLTNFFYNYFKEYHFITW